MLHNGLSFSTSPFALCLSENTAFYEPGCESEIFRNVTWTHETKITTSGISNNMHYKDLLNMRPALDPS